MNNRVIKLVNADGIVWEFRDRLLANEEFVTGFLYGGLFILNQLPQHYFILENKFPHLEYKFSRLNVIRDRMGFFNELHVPLNNIKAYTKDNTIDGHFSFWLLDPSIDNTANMANTVSSDFFRGLFTVLNVAHIPYEKVVLYKPIKDGVTYNIVDLQLPNLFDAV